MTNPKCGEAQTTKTNGKSAPEPPPIEVIIEPMMETPNNKNARSSASNSNNRRTMTTNKCVDREERCIQWRTEGLCNNSATNGTTTATKFNGGQRRACAKTCGDCK
uniref:ShKT domain-containing protein n=1 Tax=Globodera pallida TaxID=36090 RepID=A0A183C2R1_GLOPA